MKAMETFLHASFSFLFFWIFHLYILSFFLLLLLFVLLAWSLLVFLFMSLSSFTILFFYWFLCSVAIRPCWLQITPYSNKRNPFGHGLQVWLSVQSPNFPNFKNLMSDCPPTNLSSAPTRKSDRPVTRREVSQSELLLSANYYGCFRAGVLKHLLQQLIDILC